MKATMKKVLSMALAVTLTAGISIAGTKAYLTSEDSDVNVMTMGNVKIAQHEYQRVEKEEGTYKTDTIDEQTSYVLEDFEQGKAILPIVGDPSVGGDDLAYAGYDSTPVRLSQVDSYGGMDVFAGKNAVDKFVTVENTGKTDAYVRTLVAIESGSTDGSLIGHSYHFTWTETVIGKITVDGNSYYLYEYVYNGAELSDGSWRHGNGILPAGDTSYPNLSQVYLKHTANNEDMEAIDGNNNGTLDILVLSQAVQADGFANAQTALDTAFGDVTVAKAAEWFGGMGNVAYVEAGTAEEGEKPQVTGEAAAPYLAALQSGQSLVVDSEMDILAMDATSAVDAQGATVYLSGTGSDAYGYLGFFPTQSYKDVTVSNLNVTGSGFVEVGHYGISGGTYTLNNVNLTDMTSTLANNDKGLTVGLTFMAYSNVILNNCTMTGASALSDNIIPVDLGCGQSYTTTINGGEYGTIYCWSKGHAVLNGAKVDTLYAAPNNGSVIIKSGTAVDTLVLNYYSGLAANESRIGNITIENGATVNSIIYNGTCYSSLDEVKAALNEQ